MPGETAHTSKTAGLVGLPIACGAKPSASSTAGAATILLQGSSFLQG